VVGLTLLLSVGVLWWCAWSDRITVANAARIKPGMSLAAVNQLLGQQGQVAEESLPFAVGENHYVWKGTRGEIHVAFRGDLTVTDPAKFTATDSPWARLYDWLGW
jgi:hypothetical protein